MAWIRVSSNRHTHSVARALGGWGNIVIEAVWEIVKEHGRKGEVTLLAVTPEAVCEWLRLDREEGGPWTKYMAIGLERCYRAGIIIEENGRVKVRDWHQYQEDATNADRQARFRERKESNDSNALCNGVTGSNGNNDDGTGRDSNKSGCESADGYSLTPSGVPASKPKPPRKKKPVDPFRRKLLDVFEEVWTERTGTPPSSPANALGFMGGVAAWLRKAMADVDEEGHLRAFRIGLRNRKTYPKIQFLKSDIAGIMTAEVRND